MAQTVGGIIGNQIASGDRNRANDLTNQALAEFQNLQIPDIEKMKLFLEQYSSAGTLSPEQVALITQGDTALGDVSIDPRLRASQMASLTGLEELANRGMSSADMAAYELARRNAAGEAQAKQNQILQNMAQRGQAGSGAELAASLQNAQSSADRQQQAQLEEAKARQAARMQALQQQSQVASNIRGADYGEQANLANARDSIARFNAQNAQQVNMTNTGANNQAQQANLQNAQNIRNQNTGIANQQQIANKNLLQQDYNNRLSRAQGMQGAYANAADAARARAAQTQGLYSGIGAGIDRAAAAYMTGGTSELVNAGAGKTGKTPSDGMGW